MNTRAVVGALIALAGLLTIVLAGPVIGTIPALVIGLVVLMAGGALFLAATSDL